MALYARPNRPDLDPIKVPTACDIAWAAGIYEGEGTCRLCGRTKRGFMLSVAQKDPELLYWLRDWFGGSVRQPSGGNTCHQLEICGDRARLFIAQVYSRLTSRRKAQADETGCLEFLGGRSPEGMTLDQLKSAMLAYYSSAFAQTYRGNAEIRKDAQRRIYKRHAGDSEWVARINEENRQRREARTPEQIAADKEYQRKYWLRKKAKQSGLHAIEALETASQHGEKVS